MVYRISLHNSSVGKRIGSDAGGRRFESRTGSNNHSNDSNHSRHSNDSNTTVAVVVTKLVIVAGLLARVPRVPAFQQMTNTKGRPIPSSKAFNYSVRVTF